MCFAKHYSLQVKEPLPSRTAARLRGAVNKARQEAAARRPSEKLHRRRSPDRSEPLAALDARERIQARKPSSAGKRLDDSG